MAIEQVAGDVTAADARLCRTERFEEVMAMLERIGPRDREVIILRGLEQHGAKAVAEMLDISPAAVDRRYSRSLKRLREALPESVFEEFVE